MSEFEKTWRNIHKRKEEKQEYLRIQEKQLKQQQQEGEEQKQKELAIAIKFDSLINFSTRYLEKINKEFFCGEGVFANGIHSGKQHIHETSQYYWSDDGSEGHSMTTRESHIELKNGITLSTKNGDISIYALLESELDSSNLSRVLRKKNNQYYEKSPLENLIVTKECAKSGLRIPLVQDENEIKEKICEGVLEIVVNLKSLEEN